MPNTSRGYQRRPEQLDNEGVLFLRNLPKGLKTAFKEWCHRMGVSMTEKIEQLMVDTIKNSMPHRTLSKRERAKIAKGI